MKWFIYGLRRLFDIKGRASRQEYWMYFLFCFIFLIFLSFVLSFVIALIMGDSGSAGLLMGKAVGSGVGGIVSAVLLIAIQIRRLHDTGHSGKLILWSWGLQIAGTILGLAPSESLKAIALLPLLSALVLGVWVFILTLKRGDKGTNKYGPDPKATAGNL